MFILFFPRFPFFSISCLAFLTSLSTTFTFYWLSCSSYALSWKGTYLGGRLGRGDNEGADVVTCSLIVLHVRAVAQGKSPALRVVCRERNGM